MKFNGSVELRTRFQLESQVFVIFKTRVFETTSKLSTNRTFLMNWVQ